MANRGQQQYVVVTKQRKKSGCLGSMFHLFVGVFTFGLWPATVWLWHAIGPRRKEVARVYGLPAVAPGQYGQYPPQPYQPPYAPPPRAYPPPSAQPWNQPPMPQRPPYTAPPPNPPTVPYPEQEPPPDDPWDTGTMRRRS